MTHSLQSPRTEHRARGASPRSAGAIRIGQAAITLVLLAVAAVRALAEGMPPAGVVTLTLVFAGWYAGGIVLGGRTRDAGLARWWLLGLTLVWAVMVASSPEFVWLSFPLWLLAGFVLSLPWALAVSLGILVAVLVAPVLHTGATTYANVIGPLVGGVFAFGIARGYLELVREGRERRRLIASLVAAQREAAALQDELAQTQRETGAGRERARLSRDIHDTVAQSLSSIVMLARTTARAPDHTHGQALAQIEQLAREGMCEVRRIVNDLVPAELEGAALGDALRRMLTRMQQETGIRTDLAIDESIPALTTAAEVALLRTAQSALANVRRHARASRVVVTLADAGEAVRLDIVDDGVGFDASRWDAAPMPREGGGYGLRAMRARLRELGGDLDVESLPDDGVALSASVPLAAVREPSWT